VTGAIICILLKKYFYFLLYRIKTGWPGYLYTTPMFKSQLITHQFLL
jgi:hypothetical protein